MKLRVFYTIHSRILGSNNYKKIKANSDFYDPDYEKAYDQIYQQHGRFEMNPLTNRAPDEWVEIHSHTLIDPDREKVVIPHEKRIQDSLLSPQMLFASQSRKPESTYRPRGK